MSAILLMLYSQKCSLWVRTDNSFPAWLHQGSQTVSHCLHQRYARNWWQSSQISGADALL